MGVIARSVVRRLAFLLVFCLAPVADGIAGAAAPQRRAQMVNEDSHPHEVLPGAISWFFIGPVTERRTLDVKCTLSGPVGPVRLVFRGVAPTGWAASHARFHIGQAELHVDIEGVVTPDGTGHPFFEFVNDDPVRLLWHQCYNN